MTAQHFGRVTPLQAAVLGLGGVVCGVPEDLVTEESRLENMESSLKSLRRETGEDFEFDIEAWHKFLSVSEKHSTEYQLEYAWKAVRQKIIVLIDDADRLRLVTMLKRKQST